MKDIDREISKVYNYNYADKFDIEDNEQRRIYLNCEIDESIVDSAVYHILRYNRLDKDIPIEDRIPIKIYINSPGGSVADGYALIDAIRLSKTPRHDNGHRRDALDILRQTGMPVSHRRGYWSVHPFDK